MLVVSLQVSKPPSTHIPYPPPIPLLLMLVFLWLLPMLFLKLTAVNFPPLLQQLFLIISLDISNPPEII